MQQSAGHRLVLDQLVTPVREEYSASTDRNHDHPAGNAVGGTNNPRAQSSVNYTCFHFPLRSLSLLFAHWQLINDEAVRSRQANWSAGELSCITNLEAVPTERLDKVAQFLGF